MFIIATLTLASLTIALSKIINKTLSQKGHKSITYTSITTLVNAAIAFPLLFFQPHISINPLYWFLIIISVIAYGLSTIFTFSAYKNADVSAVGIFQQSNLIFVSMLGIFFLKEVYFLKRIIGLVFIIASSVILVYKKTKIDINKGVVFSIVSAFFGAFAALLDKQILNDFSPFSYVFVNNFLTALFFGFNKHTLSEASNLIKHHIGRLFATSFFNVVSFVSVLVVLKNSPVSQTMPIYKSLTLIITVSLGILILNEKMKLRQKIIGMLMGSVGILLMY